MPGKADRKSSGSSKRMPFHPFAADQRSAMGGGDSRVRARGREMAGEQGTTAFRFGRPPASGNGRTSPKLGPQKLGPIEIQMLSQQRPDTSFSTLDVLLQLQKLTEDGELQGVKIEMIDRVNSRCVALCRPVHPEGVHLSVSPRPVEVRILISFTPKPGEHAFLPSPHFALLPRALIHQSWTGKLFDELKYALDNFNSADEKAQIVPVLKFIVAQLSTCDRKSSEMGLAPVAPVDPNEIFAMDPTEVLGVKIKKSTNDKGSLASGMKASAPNTRQRASGSTSKSSAESTQPCPRYSGATFSGPGLLVYYDSGLEDQLQICKDETNSPNSANPIGRGDEKSFRSTPRTMAELKQAMTNSTPFEPAHSPSLPQATLRRQVSIRSSVSNSPVEQKDVALSEELSLADLRDIRIRSSTAEESSTRESNPNPNNAAPTELKEPDELAETQFQAKPRAAIFDISLFSPVNRFLARAYRVGAINDGNSLHALNNLMRLKRADDYILTQDSEDIYVPWDDSSIQSETEPATLEDGIWASAVRGSEDRNVAWGNDLKAAEDKGYKEADGSKQEEEDDEEDPYDSLLCWYDDFSDEADYTWNHLPVGVGNLYASQRIGRFDLIHTWLSMCVATDSRVLDYEAALVEPYEHTFANSFSKTESFMNPISGPFVSKLIDGYARFKDVQTMAVLACVVDAHRKKYPEISHEAEDSAERVEIRDNIRRAYAEILHKWGLNVKRAEIMKYVSTKQSNQQGEYDTMVLATECPTCKSVPEGKDGKCQNPGCKRNTAPGICVICDVGVRGLCTFCPKCGHGGHSDHLADWFKVSEVCPTGCGCNCGIVNDAM